MNTLNELIQKADTELLGYLQLELGWDGYRASQFDPKVIQITQYILDAAELHFQSIGGTPSEVTPGPCSDGSVYLEIVYLGKKLIFTIQDNLQVVQIYRNNGRGDECEYEVEAERLNLHKEFFWLTS